jgi:CBS domain-containing protein
MKVQGIYHPNVVTAGGDDRLADAAARMQDNQIGSLIVLPDREPIGILTEHDLARAAAEGADPEVATVADYMTAQPFVVALDTDVRDAVAAMVELECRHLPVVEAGGVVGMVSVRDLLQSALPPARGRSRNRAPAGAEEVAAVCLGEIGRDEGALPADRLGAAAGSCRHPARRSHSTLRMETSTVGRQCWSVRPSLAGQRPL